MTVPKKGKSSRPLASGSAPHGHSRHAVPSLGRVGGVPPVHLRPCLPQYLKIILIIRLLQLCHYKALEECHPEALQGYGA